MTPEIEITVNEARVTIKITFVKAPAQSPQESKRPLDFGQVQIRPAESIDLGFQQ